MRSVVIARGPDPCPPLGRGPGAVVEPSTELAGLSLVLRAVLTLQQAGASAVLVDGDAELVAEIAADPRVTLEVTRLSGPLPERMLVTRYDDVVAPAVYRQLLASEGGRRRLVDQPGDRGPWVLEAGDPLVLPPSAPALAVEPEGFVIGVVDDASLRAAEDALFEACRKPVDGIVSRHLNRRLSLAVSRRLASTPVTPNMMTFVTFGVALLACALALDGRYAYVAAAGVLMQLNSILDGCDGELARVRFQGGRLGEWLDTIGDDLSNVLFWAAVGIGASRTMPNFGPWLALAGYVTATGNGLAALVNYAVLWRQQSGDYYALVDVERQAGVVAFFYTLLRQDVFLLLVMVLALAGVLPWALPAFAVGALITLAASLSRAVGFFARQPKST